jgi:hypothetical protein
MLFCSVTSCLALSYLTLSYFTTIYSIWLANCFFCAFLSTLVPFPSLPSSIYENHPLLNTTVNVNMNVRVSRGYSCSTGVPSPDAIKVTDHRANGILSHYTSFSLSSFRLSFLVHCFNPLLSFRSLLLFITPSSLVHFFSPTLLLYFLSRPLRLIFTLHISHCPALLCSHSG